MLVKKYVKSRNFQLSLPSVVFLASLLYYYYILVRIRPKY